MTSSDEPAAPRRRLDPWETGQILDHFVSGFEWTIPTRLEILDFKFQEQFPGELDSHKLLLFSVAPPLTRIRGGPGLLEDFLKLESASDDAILAYARRWGPLWLCPLHNLPWQHDPDCEPSVSDWEADDDEGELSDEDADCLDPDELPESTYHTWYDESMSGWRDLSRQARATVRLAHRLHDGRAGQKADWDALAFLKQLLIKLVLPAVRDPFATLDDFPRSEGLEKLDVDSPSSDTNVSAPDALDGSSDPAQPQADETYGRQLEALGKKRLDESMEFQRQLLGEVLNYWLELAGVRPRLDWSGSKPVVQLGGRGLIGAVAVQLLFDCSRTDGLVVCTSCGTPFLPGPRRPRRDRNIYCPDCGIKAAMRDASARYRQTERYRRTYGQYVQRRAGQ